MIRMLVLSSDTDGVGYFRMTMPNWCINDPDLKIEIRSLSDYTLPLLDRNFLRHFKIIIFNKSLPFGNPEHEKIFIEICKEFNIKLIYDIDDYWILNSTHLNYKNWKTNKSGDKIESTIRMADIVTTTTPIFADIISKLNSNVVVLENAININENQWISNKTESDKIRFIWGGGISHIVDLRLLKDEFKKFDKDFLNKAQLIMCGYDLRIKMQDGIIKKDDSNRSQWGFFESIFTNNNKYIKSPEYKKYLDTTSNLDNDNTYGRNVNFLDEFYQRRHTKPILDYGTMYNEAEIGIAPLKNNHSFNLVKSELKLIEAGAHKIPIIMSNYGPYSLNSVDGKKDGIQKGFLIDESKSNWYEKMKWYVNNPTAIKEHGMANHEYFLKTFEMSVVNKKRISLYKHIADQNRCEVKLD